MLMGTAFLSRCTLTHTHTDSTYSTCTDKRGRALFKPGTVSHHKTAVLVLLLCSSDKMFPFTVHVLFPWGFLFKFVRISISDCDWTQTNLIQALGIHFVLPQLPSESFLRRLQAVRSFLLQELRVLVPPRCKVCVRFLSLQAGIA